MNPSGRDLAVPVAVVAALVLVVAVVSTAMRVNDVHPLPLQRCRN